MVALPRLGTWLVGYQIGSSIGSAVPLCTTTGGELGGAGSKTRFFHTPEMWQELWRQIQIKTSTKWDG